MSTTVLIECPALIGGGGIALSGPGIQDTIEIAPSGLRDEFWIEVQENNSLYPRGVDLMFTSGHQLVAVPRSIQILGQA
jgi:alpha-D-ribose 1-methylphosphonate 5-triphosphate synthase subunit PhnH